MLRANPTEKEQREFELATDRLIERARELVPRVRASADETEALRRLPESTMADVEVFMDALVPKRWGGQGLGLRALCEVARELAHGDASTSWITSFFMEHSWMACRLPLETQEELFAERPYILAAAPTAPTGRATRVDGGFRVSGTFRWASCIWNGEWSFATALVDDGDGRPMPHSMLVPTSDMTVNDDWFMSGMAGTGSASFVLDDVFVPEGRSLPTLVFLSSDEHPGAVHEEAFMRYPLMPTISTMIAGIALGCGEACVDIVRERLPKSKVFGMTPRLELPLSRVRWGTAYEQVRCARLLWTDTIERTIVKCDAMEPWSEAETGQLELDLVTVIQLSQQAVGLLCDGIGSSVYQLSDPLQRYRRDVNVIASHAFHEHDLVAERATRLILGLGLNDNDPSLLPRT